MSTDRPKSAARARKSGSALPARPDLDHLRRRAKQLLAGVREHDLEAAAEFIAHLPTARKLKPEQVYAAGYRLADAQSTVARSLGFGGWPALSRHVESLRALEGDWSFVSLEVDGQPVPPSFLGASRILIDGDRFRTESPEANYDGEFLIDVEASPHTIDITFIQGPEAGNQSLGIFTIDGDTLTICLGLTGATRPRTFATSRNSQHALETLRRVSKARPAGVTGGHTADHASASAKAVPAETTAPAVTHETFVESASALDTALAGEWSAIELVRNGQVMPEQWLSAGRRTAANGEVQVIFGGQKMVHARVRYDDRESPAHVDYLYLAGEHKGKVAFGICALDGNVLRVNMAPPGAPRPTDWESTTGSARTFTRWRKLT